MVEQPHEKPELAELAQTVGGRDITRGWVSAHALQPSEDSILQTKGQGSHALYREVLRDWQVASTFQQRRLAVIAREYDVRPGGTDKASVAAADFLRDQLSALDFDGATDRMMFGIFYGFAVAECLWARDGRFVTLDRLKVRNRERFGFDGLGRLRLRTTANYDPGELMPERKFWAFRTGADHDDEPYGLGLAHWLYWPVWFKKNDVKFWLIFLEKYGQPTPVGKYPAGATPEQKASLLSAAESLHTDRAVAIPAGMLLELLEAKRSGTADYVTHLDRMDAAITKVVLGQTMTTEAAGGQYKGETHMKVRQELVKADADVVCGSFNRGPARWLTEWNFPTAKPPQVWRSFPDPDADNLAERAQKLRSVGYRPTLAQVQTQLGGEWELAPQQGVAPSSAEFGEGAGAPDPAGPLLAAQVDRLEADAASARAAMMEPLRRLVQQAGSLEELRDMLMRTYGDMPLDAFVDQLRAGMVAAHLAGRDAVRG